MNGKTVRLGPLALVLTVISICLSTFAILTYSTAKADLALAQRFADAVAVRYELEKEGRSYVSQRLADGYSGTIEKEFEKDGYRLEIEAGTEDGSYTVRKWKITREWVQDEHIEGLWPGQ